MMARGITYDECGRLRGVRQPHVFRQWSEASDRCIWCGYIRPRPVATAGTPRGEVAPDTETAPAPECCSGSETRQTSYPRPTITERHENENH